MALSRPPRGVRAENRGASEDYELRHGHGSAFDVEGAGASRAAALKAAAYRGLGPRGYRRSDERIREDVCDSLTDDARLDASNMEVLVEDGVVTLSGTVHSRDDKRRAEDLAEVVTGVTDVYNRLRLVVPADDLTPKGDTSSPMSEITATQTAQH